MGNNQSSSNRSSICLPFTSKSVPSAHNPTTTDTKKTSNDSASSSSSPKSSKSSKPSLSPISGSTKHRNHSLRNHSMNSEPIRLLSSDTSAPLIDIDVPMLQRTISDDYRHSITIAVKKNLAQRRSIFQPLTQPNTYSSSTHPTAVRKSSTASLSKPSFATTPSTAPITMTITQPKTMQEALELLTNITGLAPLIKHPINESNVTIEEKKEENKSKTLPPPAPTHNSTLSSTSLSPPSSSPSSASPTLINGIPIAPPPPSIESSHNHLPEKFLAPTPPPPPIAPTMIPAAASSASPPATYWNKGTGYGHSGQNAWDIGKFVMEQNTKINKLKQLIDFIQNILTADIQQIEKKTKKKNDDQIKQEQSDYVTLLYSSSLLPYLNSVFSIDSFMEILQKNEYVLAVLQLTEALLTSSWLSALFFITNDNNTNNASLPSFSISDKLRSWKKYAQAAEKVSKAERDAVDREIEKENKKQAENNSKVEVSEKEKQKTTTEKIIKNKRYRALSISSSTTTTNNNSNNNTSTVIPKQFERQLKEIETIRRLSSRMIGVCRLMEIASKKNHRLKESLAKAALDPLYHNEEKNAEENDETPSDSRCSHNDEEGESIPIEASNDAIIVSSCIRIDEKGEPQLLIVPIGKEKDAYSNNNKNGTMNNSAISASVPLSAASSNQSKNEEKSEEKSLSSGCSVTLSDYIPLLRKELFREVDSFRHHHYWAGHHSSFAPNRAYIRRLATEYNDLRCSLPLTPDSSVYLRVHEGAMGFAQMLILAPPDTPYGFGAFLFDVFFPTNYPSSPPMINLMTTGKASVRFNPNLYNDGKVCLSLLGTWSGSNGETWNASTSTFLQVAVSIQSLIFVSQPYFNEPGYEKNIGTESGKKSSREYNIRIEKECVQWAMIDQLKNPPKGFEDVIATHFAINQQRILTQVEGWSNDNNGVKSLIPQLKELLQNQKVSQKLIDRLNKNGVDDDDE